MNFNGLVIGVLMVLSAVLIGVSTKIIVKRDTDSQIDSQNTGYMAGIEKRPFCNAFTGCGKKRSSNAGFDSLESREMMGTDPLMRLSQRILREAKQWELLQNKYNQISRQESPVLDYMSSRKKRSISSKVNTR